MNAPTHRYTKEDWRLYRAVSRFKHDQIGRVNVSVVGGRISVSYNGTTFFQYDPAQDYWRVDSWGNTRPWFVAKVNACLHAINADARAFVENCGLCVVHVSGFAAYVVKWFNNRFYTREV